jgi:hypothetical protein
LRISIAGAGSGATLPRPGPLQRGNTLLDRDSISVSLAFWAPLAEKPSKMSDEGLQDWQIVHDHQRSECWSQWRGPEYGNEGGMTIRWADENVQQWLEKLNPEVAVIMFGTNDLGQLEAKEYEAKTRSVVERCLENGTIVILTTLPPRHGFDEKATKFADIVRSLADQLHVPLVDYHKAILDRRPDDWDGALEKFRDAPGDEYNVPTLIARDGVHPSYPGGYRDYSEESLDNNGYALRSVITMQRYAEVIRTVLAPK